MVEVFFFLWKIQRKKILLHEIRWNWNVLPEIHKSCESFILNSLLIEKKSVLIKDILMKTSIFTFVRTY